MYNNQFVVQSNLIDIEKQKCLAQAVIDSGFKLFEIQVIPFTTDVVFPFKEPDHQFPIIPIGSTKLIKISRDNNWSGLFYNENFKMSVFNANRKDMLNQDAVFVSVKTMKETTNINDYKKEENVFVKPDEDLKEFSGVVTTCEELFDWQNSKDNNNPDLNENTIIAVAEPKNIHYEWRCFVVDGEVITATKYKDHINKGHGTVIGDVEFDLSRFQTLADVWLPHKCCVMDIAQVKEGLKVIEFNCLNGAGFYNKNDILPVIKSINQYF